MLNEVRVFLSALLTGFILGFAYDLLRMKRRAIRTRRFFVGVEDVLFWIFAAITAFAAAYISNQGEIRPYFFMAMVMGIGIYFWLFSRLITRIIVFIVKIVIWPFAKLFILLRPLIRWLSDRMGKLSREVNKKIADRRFVARRRLRSLRNIMKKI